MNIYILCLALIFLYAGRNMLDVKAAGNHHHHTEACYVTHTHVPNVCYHTCGASIIDFGYSDMAVDLDGDGNPDYGGGQSGRFWWTCSRGHTGGGGYDPVWSSGASYRPSSCGVTTWTCSKPAGYKDLICGQTETWGYYIKTIYKDKFGNLISTDMSEELTSDSKVKICTPVSKKHYITPETQTITLADSDDTVITVTYIKVTADYTVKHYKQNVDGTFSEVPSETEVFIGDIGNSVTPIVKTYVGFDSPSEKTITVKTDDTAYVEYKYTRKSYSFDLNGILDGVKTYGNGTEGAIWATCDIYINNHLVGNEVSDWVDTYLYETKIEIKNITPFPGREYKGVYAGATTVTLTTNKETVLKFESKKYELEFNGNKPSNATSDVQLSSVSKIVTYSKKVGDLPTPSLLGWTVNVKDSNIWHINGNYINSNTVWKYTDNQIASVDWTANEYIITYNKGLTNVNNNAPTDTKCLYDSDVQLRTYENLIGREYKVIFDSNKPISSELQPSQVDAITGNLLFDRWVTDKKSKLNTQNCVFQSGELLKKPNFVDGTSGNKNVIATARWSNKIINNYETPVLNGWTFVGWYDNQEGTGDSNSIGSGKITELKVTPATSYYQKKLYARWQRTVQLTFNMQGGAYKGKKDDVVLKGVYYTNADGYSFNIKDGITLMKLPDYDEQSNTIDAYGTYDSNGINMKYTKVVDGVEYRFLGWSLTPTATEPDISLCPYNSNRKSTYTIYNNTTLYAVWEPVLSINFTLQRTLGNLKFTDGASPISTIHSISAVTPNPQVSTIIKPGEQGQYIIETKNEDLVVKVAFDTKITDIYTPEGTWQDSLNPSTSEDLVTGQAHGLDREYTTRSSYESRKFYIPQYLGTEQSYVTSKGVNVYNMMCTISQSSYYYDKVYGKEEDIEIIGTIYISPNKTYSNTEIPSVLDELRSKLKIVLK